MGKITPRPGSRQALLAALVSAAVVVVLSFAVPGPGAPLLAVLPPAALFVVRHFVVRWAVAAGLRDADRSGGARTAREILDRRHAGDEFGAEGYVRVRSRLETPWRPARITLRAL